jgi:pimeloyl-ACP methyl ester carboxylesterase
MDHMDRQAPSSGRSPLIPPHPARSTPALDTISVTEARLAYAGTLGDGVFSIQLGTCIGDCNSDGTITVDEIVTGVTIAQDFSPLGECPAFDAGADGSVTIDEIIAGVNNGLNGCPTEGTGCKAVDGNADIDVGGYHLRVNCVGSGEPTIIFDSGTGSGIEAWRAVQPTVGGFTRACAYNRAGYGQSNPGPLPRTSEQIVSELHTLLKNSCLPGPYVLVGHSFGGLNIHLYASTYPQDVAGLVFVDGTPAEFCDRWAASGLADVRPCIRCPIQSGALGSECLNIETSQAQVQSAGPLPDVPTVVFVAGAFQAHSGPPLTGAQSQQRENMWLELQTGLAHSVPDGTLVATDCPHAIQDCRPDLITSVVQTMVETIRIEHSGAPMVAPR